MSLYKKLFGENEDAMALLGMIDLTRNEFQRYRDVYLNKSGTIITVITRLGGDNRKEYEQVFKNIRKNLYYIKDFDDNIDDTYAYFQFKVPSKYEYTCKTIAPKEEWQSVGERMIKAIEEAQKPDSDIFKKMEEIADEIMKNIENGNHFIGI